MHDFILNEAVFHAWSDRFIPPEQPIIEWARQFQSKDKVALDIGAHVGDWAVDMALYSAYVDAWEPQAKTFHLLQANCNRYSNIFCHKSALGNESKFGVKLYIPSADGGGSSLVRTPIHKFAPAEDVTVNCLDAFGCTNISLIKIDVEGHECEVIAGGLGTLKASGWPRLIFEAWSYDWFAPEKARLMDYVKSLGYTVVPVSGNDWTFLAERRS
jgi:FkbM family methyltransferase